MKASFQHLSLQSEQASFRCFWVRSPRFGFHWHYHPECEITYVVRGRGTRLVGDHVAPFSEGDLIFLGSDLPHTWISADSFNASGEEMQVVVLQFPREILEVQAQALPELSSIGRLLEASHRGLNFDLNLRTEIGQQLIALIDLKHFARYHLLLEILHKLGSAPFEALASPLYTPNRNPDTESRIGKVCAHIHAHFSEAISIAELAGLASMHEAAFCRFFKQMTGRTAITYITDLRIGKACELLANESLSIGEIGYMCGYNSPTHFHRSFLKCKGQSPSSFRRHYQGT